MRLLNAYSTAEATSRILKPCQPNANAKPSSGRIQLRQLDAHWTTAANTIYRVRDNARKGHDNGMYPSCPTVLSLNPAFATLALAFASSLNMLPSRPRPRLLPLLVSGMRSTCFLPACTDLYGSSSLA